MQPTDTLVLMRLKAASTELTKQQYRTLRGQVFAGDSLGALRGLKKILTDRKEAKHGDETRHNTQPCRRK